jgi:hypothetical protein
MKNSSVEELMHAMDEASTYNVMLWVNGSIALKKIYNGRASHRSVAVA